MFGRFGQPLPIFQKDSRLNPPSLDLALSVTLPITVSFIEMDRIRCPTDIESDAMHSCECCLPLGTGWLTSFAMLSIMQGSETSQQGTVLPSWQ